MQIVVSILPGEKQIILEVESSDSVLTVKEKIKDKEGIPIEEQVLFYSDKSLLNSDVLADHNIKNNDILVVRQISVGLYCEGEILQSMSGPGIPDIPSDILMEYRDSAKKKIRTTSSYHEKINTMELSRPDIPDIPSEILMECRRSVTKRPPCTIM